MDDVILEVLKSNLTKNSIEAVAENKPLQYSSIECLEDCLKIGKAIVDEVNKYNQKQQEFQHHIFANSIVNLFMRLHKCSVKLNTGKSQSNRVRNCFCSKAISQ